MATQHAKALAFAALHQPGRTFVIPNPWDVGSARLLASLGFKALALTSAGYAFSAGLQDFDVGLDRMMHHLREIASATDLPLSADLRLRSCRGAHAGGGGSRPRPPLSLHPDRARREPAARP